jgi:hypothetical protein
VEWNQRIELMAQWGKSIRNLNWEPYYRKIEHSNPWFTRDNVALALDGVCRYLDPIKLNHWQGLYQSKSLTPKNTGIIMAGNIPLVGVHDLICCYLSGHKAVVKPSSQDHILLRLLIEKFSDIDRDIENKIHFVTRPEAANLDAVIATGSDNTSRYFKFHFDRLPGIIRSNRTSVAVIRGDENSSQLRSLGQDVYSYFGRGCRNISKLLVPADYDFDQLINCHKQYRILLDNSKYRDNYRYQKALALTEYKNVVDTGYSLLIRSEALVSPLAVLYFDYYEDLDDLRDELKEQEEKIQCIASANGWYQESLPFGSLQHPDLWDYADGIDTMEFLLAL